MFSRLNRPEGLEKATPRDWKTGAPIALDERSLNSLNLMEAARLLEEGAVLAEYPHLHMAWLRYARTV
jgi:hypothetical protein